MKKLLIPIVLLILGVAVGGAAAFGTALLTGARTARAEQGSADTSFVPTGQILAPMVFPDGRLAGYVNFEAQLEVPQDRADLVKQRLPVLLNAVNMRTYRTPMTSGRDGLVPGVEAFRRVLRAAAVETYGRATIRKVAVTQATPA